MKNTKSTTTALVFPSLADKKGATLVAIIQGAIRQGFAKSEVLDAYCTARFPEVEAGTLLRTEHGANARTLSSPTEVSKAKSDLRKHANTHYKMANAEMTPEAVAARVEAARVSVAAAEATLEARKVKAAALNAA
jgi:hypothetical protein